MTDNIIQVEPAAVIPVQVKVIGFDCRSSGEPYAERTLIEKTVPVAKPLGIKHQLTVINKAVSTGYDSIVATADKQGKTVLGWRYEVIWSNKKKRVVV